MSKQGIIDQLNKIYGNNSVAKVKDMGDITILRDSTGSIEIDHITGGGVPRGGITEIYGPESSGKTTLTLHIIAEKQKQLQLDKDDRDIAFIDMEHALDTTWAETLGVNVDELVLTQPDNGEQALEIAYKLIDSGEFAMVVIDSVAACRPKKEIEGEMGDAIVGLQAKLMSQACPKISIASKKRNCTTIMINQIRHKIGVTFGSPETTPAGMALKFYAMMRLDIRNIGQIKPGDVRIGNMTKVTCVKNKASKPFGVCNTRLTYGIGIDWVWELFRLAIDAQIIEKSGSWYSMADTRLGQGEENVLTHLRQDPDTLQSIEYLVNQALKENV
jgi:recombination protein RecA